MDQTPTSPRISGQELQVNFIVDSPTQLTVESVASTALEKPLPKPPKQSLSAMTLRDTYCSREGAEELNEDKVNEELNKENIGENLNVYFIDQFEKVKKDGVKNIKSADSRRNYCTEGILTPNSALKSFDFQQATNENKNYSAATEDNENMELWGYQSTVEDWDDTPYTENKASKNVWIMQDEESDGDFSCNVMWYQPEKHAVSSTNVLHQQDYNENNLYVTSTESNLPDFNNYITNSSPFPGKRTCLALVDSISNPKVNLNVKTCSIKPQKNICNFCQKVFRAPSHLERHIRKHTGEKPFKCELKNCNQAFAYKYCLLRHIKQHGTPGEKVYLCCYCNLPFKKPKTRLIHQKNCAKK